MKVIETCLTFKTIQYLCGTYLFFYSMSFQVDNTNSYPSENKFTKLEREDFSTRSNPKPSLF